MTEWQNRITGQGVRPASEYQHNPRNPRKHPEKQRKALRGSLDTLGWIAPVIVNTRTGYLIDGHERVYQALAQGAGTPVPYIEVDLAEHEEAQALATFDFITYMAEYENETLNALLQEVNSDDANIQQLMADMAQDFGLLDDVPVVEVEARIDEAAELNKKWQVQTGDLWQIGKHRLMCGDSTSAADVERLMDGDTEQSMMVTDPPYGVKYDQEWRSSNRVRKVTNDHLFDWRDAYKLSNSDVVYCWHASRHASSVQDGLEEAGFELRAQIIWNKPRHVFHKGITTGNMNLVIMLYAKAKLHSG